MGKSGAYYLVVESDPVRITDATIEGFGYVLAQLLRNLSIENNQLVTNKKSPFNEALKGLSAKFINEIRKKPAYSMDAYDVRLDKSLPVGTDLRSCDIPDSALQRSFDSAAFALHFRATHCSVASRSLDIAFQADSKAYYDQYMTPFIQALLDGKRLDYIPPKSCSAVAYAGGFDISKFFDALLNFSQNSNTACSLWSCANAPSGSDAMSNDSNKDLFSPFSTADGSTVWGGSGDDSYSDSILSNTDLSANGLGSSMANSFGAVTDSNGDPLGDFARTCVDEIWQDDILKMKCMGTDGKLYNSQIPRSEIDKCTNDGDQINNINGSIQCGDYSYAVDSDNPVEDDYEWCSKNDDTRNGWGQENGKPCRANPRELSDAWTSNDPSINSDSSSNDEYDGEMNGDHSCSDQRKWHGCEPSWMKGTCGCPDE
jgi:hypothetical protein